MLMLILLPVRWYPFSIFPIQSRSVLRVEVYTIYETPKWNDENDGVSTFKKINLFRNDRFYILYYVPYRYTHEPLPTLHRHHRVVLMFIAFSRWERIFVIEKGVSIPLFTFINNIKSQKQNIYSIVNNDYKLI